MDFDCTNCKHLENMIHSKVCPNCFKGDRWEPIPKTRADRIRAMTDEELAVMLAWPYLASPPWCAEHRTCPYINEDQTPCDKCCAEWLRQEGE